jgi:hypothetical protein
MEFKGFVKLNNSNYFNWKDRMEMLLIREKYWKYATKVKPEKDPPADWDEKDAEGRALIGLCIEDSQLVHYRQETTMKGVWDRLKNHHQKNTISNKVSIMRGICSSKLSEGGDAEAHINDMENRFQQLKDLGEDALSNSWSIAMLLSSLPTSYDTLVTTLEGKNEGALELGYVQSKIIAEYKRKLNPESENSDSALKIRNQRFEDENGCYFCHEKTHLKRDCQKYKAWKLKKEGHKANVVEDEEHYAF